MRADGLKVAIRRLVEALWPELAHRTHLPHKARVVKVNSKSGVAGPPGETLYSVDVEPLTPDGKPDPRRPEVIKDVPLDVPWMGAGRGVYALPEPGTIVRIAYYDGNPAYPYVDGIVGEGKRVVEVRPGEWLLQKDADTWIRIHPDGAVEAQAAPGVRLLLHPDGGGGAGGNQRGEGERPPGGVGGGRAAGGPGGGYGASRSLHRADHLR